MCKAWDKWGKGWGGWQHNRQAGRHKARTTRQAFSTPSTIHNTITMDRAGKVQAGRVHGWEVVQMAGR